MSDKKSFSPKFKAAILYMEERLRCRKQDGEGNLVPLTLVDIDVTAWMCGWDAALQWMEENK